MKKGSLLGDLAGKIKNIDGKILGKNGKPMVARRCIRSSGVTKESVSGEVRREDIDSRFVEHAAHTVEQPITSDHQKCMVQEAVNHLDLGSKITMVTVPSNHTNVAPIEQNISSAVTLPKDAIDEINARFVHTLYGFPVGKRLAFPMVENYVKHVWAKFGLKRVMMHHGSFMFQFESQTGMEKVMEGGPWRIQLVPFILKVWMPHSLIQKENMSNVPLWVKMHNVPIVAYLMVGLDLISAKVGRLMRLDAHTKFICLNSWGRSEYARALVEVSAEKPLPPRCGTCKKFDHLESVCPKKLIDCPVKKKSDMKAAMEKDKRPVQTTGKKDKGKQVSNQRYIKGYRVNNPKTKLVYRAVVKPQSDNHGTSYMEQSSDSTKKPSLSDSSKNGDDDIKLDELRNFVNKTMEEESVLEYIGNNDIDGCNLREKQDEKVSVKKPNLSMDVINEDSDTDEDEIFLPNDGISLPSSSVGGGQLLEEEMLNAYDDYEDQFEEYPSSYQDFCDHFDFKVKGRGRK
ncbi:zinc knuckle CX2CX4HX4C containing protein [Tanacetum coccineum]